MPYNKKYMDAWRASPERPRAKCHPEKPHRARGLCATCYDRWLYANSAKNRATKLRNAARWKAANVAKVRAGQRANHLQKRYGISEADVAGMLAAQRKRCAICGRVLKLHIDHCHKTGKVRGMLCLRCNGSLAWVEQLLRQQKSEWFKQAMRYLGAYKNPEA
jgi:hypothetical protein